MLPPAAGILLFIMPYDCGCSQLKVLWVHLVWEEEEEKDRAPRLHHQSRPRCPLRWAQSLRKQRRRFLQIQASAAQRRRVSCRQSMNANTLTTWRTRWKVGPVDRLFKKGLMTNDLSTQLYLDTFTQFWIVLGSSFKIISEGFINEVITFYNMVLVIL